MYNIVVLKSAEKALLKLPPKVQTKIMEAIDALAEDPRPLEVKN